MPVIQLVFIFIVLFFLGCTIPYHHVTPDYIKCENNFIIDVPVIKQKGNNCCGVACLSMVITYWYIYDDHLLDLLQKLKCPKKGFSGKELKSIAENNGFNAYIFRGRMYDILRHIKSTRPLIVMLGSGKIRHFSTIVGFSEEKQHVILIDPNKGMVYMKYKDFMVAWEESKRFTLLIVPKIKTTE